MTRSPSPRLPRSPSPDRRRPPSPSPRRSMPTRTRRSSTAWPFASSASAVRRSVSPGAIFGRGRRHRHRTDRLHHAHRGFVRNVARRRGHGGRTATRRRHQAVRIDGGHRCVRARPRYGRGLHRPPELVEHLDRQLRGLPQRHERHGVGSHRDFGRDGCQHCQRGTPGCAVGGGRNRRLARRHAGHEAGRVHCRRRLVARCPRELGVLHRVAVRIQRLGTPGAACRPGAISASAGDTVTEPAAWATVTVALPDAEPATAVIVAVPLLAAVTRPDASTVATPGLPDVQVTAAPRHHLPVLVADLRPELHRRAQRGQLGRARTDRDRRGPWRIRGRWRRRRRRRRRIGGRITTTSQPAQDPQGQLRKQALDEDSCRSRAKRRDAVVVFRPDGRRRRWIDASPERRDARTAAQSARNHARDASLRVDEDAHCAAASSEVPTLESGTIRCGARTSKTL